MSIQIKLNSAERTVLVDLLAKVENLQDNISKLCKEIAESRSIEVKENLEWVLTRDYTTLIGNIKETDNDIERTE